MTDCNPEPCPYNSTPAAAAKASSQVSHPRKQLFKYHMDKNLALEAKQLKFFNRINRWRFNTVNRQHMTKWFRVKPFVFLGLATIILVDWTIGWDLPVHEH